MGLLGARFYDGHAIILCYDANKVATPAEAEDDLTSLVCGPSGNGLSSSVGLIPD